MYKDIGSNKLVLEEIEVKLEKINNDLKANKSDPNHYTKDSLGFVVYEVEYEKTFLINH